MTPGSPEAVALWVHCAVMAVVVAGAAALLNHSRQLTPTHSGFWVLVAMGTYFVVNPAVSILTENLSAFGVRLAFAGGAERVRWVTVLTALGLTVLVVAYAVPTPIRARRASPAPIRWSPLVWAAVLGATAMGFYAILAFRTGGQFLAGAERPEIVEGRFVSGPTGYVVTAHKLALVPIVVLLLDDRRWRRRFGVGLGLAYLALRAFDPWDRQTLVVLVLAAVLAFGFAPGAEEDVSGRGRTRRWWSQWLGLAAVGLVTLALADRGHRSVDEYLSEGARLAAAPDVLVLTDTSMLASLQLDTYLTDQIGFDYGLPTIAAAVFGPLPRKYFPWKDEPLRKLGGAEPTVAGETMYALRQGTKITFVGWWYRHGGALGVALGGLVIGRLCRVLDAMVHDASTQRGRALGLVWLAGVWMMAASGDLWIMSMLLTTWFPAGLIALAEWSSRGLERGRPNIIGPP